MAITSVTANVTTSSTAFSDVTGLTFALDASKDYYFKFVLHHSSSATTVGIRFGVNGPLSPTSLRVGGLVPISTVAANYGSQTAYDTAIFASTTGTNVAVMSIIEGVIRNGSSTGNLACRVAAETAATVTVLANSHGFCVPLG
jgi:hypothetical protein